MLVASLIVTAGTQLIISLLGLRGANLRRSLADLFETACDDGDAKRYGKIIARRVLRHPLISGSVFSRFGIRIDELPFVPEDAAGKLRWVGSGIPFQPWLLGALGGFFVWPATLATIERLSSLDICTLSSTVTTYVPFLSFCEHPWRTGAIVGAVLGGLISRWRLATSVRADELVAVLEKLSTPPGGSLPDPAQRAMLVIAGEAQSGPRLKINSTAAEFAKFVQELPENDEDDMAVVVEKTAKQVSRQFEPRLEGLNSWFDHAMDRASQRFTLQARVITVVLSLVLVLAAHLDAIRLFRMLSSDTQVRAQLTGSADAITKQAGQLSRTREDGTSREVVPDIYRKAMVEVLQPITISVDQTKSKSRHTSRHIATPAPTASQLVAGGSLAESPDGVRAAIQVPVDGAFVPPSFQPAPEPPVKEPWHKSSSSSKAKSPGTEVEKSTAALAEDRATLEAKSRASKALETTSGFTSREGAVSWLRGTLGSDPAFENLVANYEQAVNAQLVSDADKLIDHSASLKYDLARSELQLVPEKWQGWKPTGNELPGFLVALALLSLGAPVCYNLLRTISSLRPLSSTGTIIHPDRRIRREDRLYPQMREQVRPQTRAQVKVPEKTDDERQPASAGHIDSLL
ncbi:MAG: hypothetical protein LAO08_04670 [Acidobacteriia bacterium]|nr:hypothetical protein [Terriglobia bacterium]